MKPTKQTYSVRLYQFLPDLHFPPIRQTVVAEYHLHRSSGREITAKGSSVKSTADGSFMICDTKDVLLFKGVVFADKR